MDVLQTAAEGSVYLVILCLCLWVLIAMLRVIAGGTARAVKPRVDAARVFASAFRSSMRKKTPQPEIVILKTKKPRRRFFARVLQSYRSAYDRTFHGVIDD